MHAPLCVFSYFKSFHPISIWFFVSIPFISFSIVLFHFPFPNVFCLFYLQFHFPFPFSIAISTLIFHLQFKFLIFCWCSFSISSYNAVFLLTWFPFFSFLTLRVCISWIFNIHFLFQQFHHFFVSNLMFFPTLFPFNFCQVYFFWFCIFSGISVYHVLFGALGSKTGQNNIFYIITKNNN